MSNRLRFIVALTLLGLTGCVTYTAHRLPIATNPLREEAAACEAACRASDTSPGMAGYAVCLDHCPGATLSVGKLCPHPERPGEVCAQTTKANQDATVAGIAVGFVLLLAVAVFIVAGMFVHSVQSAGGFS